MTKVFSGENLAFLALVKVFLGENLAFISDIFACNDISDWFSKLFDCDKGVIDVKKEIDDSLKVIDDSLVSISIGCKGKLSG